jgi:serine/threonine-protein kinase
VIAGKYIVAELLGRGAMGVVVAAMHRELEQRVAIKFMSAAHRDPAQARARFVREARAVASLENEHIVRLLDFGTLEDGAPYMVMQYLSGQDLLRELKTAGGTLTAPEAADFVMQACVGLAEAHAQGIVHRDIKPSNLFVTRRANGEPLLKLLDFGISKADDASPGELSLTDSSSLLGSPLYMSPEQIRQAKSVDQRTDIWSLGVVLYHLLVGKSPFAGVGASAVVAAIVADEPAPLEGLGIAPGLSRVVARCLQKVPAYRYQNVVELARDLAPFGSRRAKLWLAQLEARSEPSPPTSSQLVARTFDDHSSPAEGADTAAPSVMERTDAPRSPTQPRRRRLLISLGAALVVLAGATVLVWPRPSSPAASAAPSAPVSAIAIAKPSVAEPAATSASAPAPAIATSRAVAPAPVTSAQVSTAERIHAPSPRPRSASTQAPPRTAKPHTPDPLDDHT